MSMHGQFGAGSYGGAYNARSPYPYQDILNMNTNDIRSLQLQQQQMQRLIRPAAAAGPQRMQQMVNEVRMGQRPLSSLPPSQAWSAPPLAAQRFSPTTQPTATQPVAPTPAGGAWELTASGLDVLLAFVVFAIAFAIIKSLFNRVWGSIPKESKSKWKKELKRRIPGQGNKKNERRQHLGHEAFNPNNNTDHGPYQAMDDSETGVPSEAPRIGETEKESFVKKGKKNMQRNMQKLFGTTKKKQNDELQQFQMVHLDGSDTNEDEQITEMTDKDKNKAWGAQKTQESTAVGALKSLSSSGIQSAASFVGMGKGSTYNPVKAAVVEDDSDEELEEFKNQDQIIQAQVLPEDEPLGMETIAGDVLNELDIMADSESPSLNGYMIMDEDMTHL